MAKNKNSSGLARLNVFANSPKVVKLFGVLIMLLAVLAVGYGIYTLTRDKPSDAASSSSGAWRHDSKGISHEGGSAANYNTTKGNRKVWKTGIFDAHKLVWKGPYKQLTSGRQYVGCAFYAFSSSLIGIGGIGGGRSAIQIYDKTRKKVLRTYAINANEPHQSKKFNKTCLAFHIPKAWKNNRIGVDILHYSGTLNIRETKISTIKKHNKNLGNQWIFKKGADNQTITQSYGFTL